MGRLRWITIALVVLSLLGTAFAQDDEAALREAGEQWAAYYNEPDLEALAELYAEDLRYIAPDAEDITTREGLLERWQGLHDAGFTEIVIEQDEIEVFGEVAYVIGTFTFNMGAQASRSGDFLIIAQRMDGGWTFARHIFNFDQLPEPAGDQ